MKWSGSNADRDSDLLCAGKVRGSNPGGRWDFPHSSRPWGPSSLLYNWYRVSSPGVKWPGRDVDHPPPSSAEVKERVDLYLYSLSGPSWPVIGWNLFLLGSNRSIFVKYIDTLRDLRCSQLSSAMWCCFGGRVVQQSIEGSYCLHLQDQAVSSWIAWPWRWRHYDPSILRWTTRPSKQYHIAWHSIKTPASLCLMYSIRVTLMASFLHLSNIINKFATLTSKIYAHTNLILLNIIGVYKRLIDKNLRLGLYTSAPKKKKRPVTFIGLLDTAIKWKVRYTVELSLSPSFCFEIYTNAYFRKYIFRTSDTTYYWVSWIIQ